MAENQPFVYERPMQDPASAPWDLNITNKDFRRLKRGFNPQCMEDRWAVKVTDPDQDGKISVHISRSWTEMHCYALAVKPRDGKNSAKIEAITWDLNRDGLYTKEEQAKGQAACVCRWVLGCELGELPNYDGQDFWHYPRPQTDAN